MDYTFDTTICLMPGIVVRYPIADMKTVVCFLVRLDAALDHRGRHGALPDLLSDAVDGKVRCATGRRGKSDARKQT